MKKLAIIFLLVSIVGCSSAPTDFESSGEKFRMKGCEDMRKRDEKANC